MKQFNITDHSKLPSGIYTAHSLFSSSRNENDTAVLSLKTSMNSTQGRTNTKPALNCPEFRDKRDTNHAASLTLATLGIDNAK